ncbi:MAG TPA: DUF2252 domain-containing protein [Acidimicrobiia bacterium]|jgi:uncharacterized protein (DUF2252 family)
MIDTETPDVTTRANRGRAARANTPRSCHAEWSPPSDRRPALDVLLEQEITRVAELVPLRHERMLESQFAFYRGAAAVMAGDLATTPASGIRVQCCGDAHLANFGGFESPERTLVFDINDFDETVPGPWEWDVKRLAASFVIAAHDRGFDDTVASAAVADTVRTYRETMRDFAGQSNLAVWYAKLDVQDALTRWRGEIGTRSAKQIQRLAAQAHAKNSLRALKKLTERIDGEIRIVDDPPLVVRIDTLWGAPAASELIAQMAELIRSYAHTLQPDRRVLIDGYQFVDIARKVVGVGSVGTRCWIVLLLGRDDGDPLFLQVKEAEASVLEPFAGKSEYTLHGQRVVEGQRLMQATSDIFLGWERFAGVDGVDRDYYVRQLWDGKVSADLQTLFAQQLSTYGRMCGWTLARAHARSGDRIAIAAYLGSGDAFDRAITSFALRYAEQNAADYAAVSEAARSGRIPTNTPVPV